MLSVAMGVFSLDSDLFPMCQKRGLLMNRLTSLTLASLLLAAAAPVSFAQSTQQSPTYYGQATQANQAILSDFAIDELTARIALFPDTTLADLLPASTTPLEVVAADQYRTTYPYSSPEFIQSQPWPQAVRNLALNAPAALRMLAQDIRWTQSMGYTFAYQPVDVNRSIQKLRASALYAGTLRSGPTQEVVVDNGVIRILPPRPVVVVPAPVVYVPTPVPQPVVVCPPPPPPVCEPQWGIGVNIRIGERPAPRIPEYRPGPWEHHGRDRDDRGRDRDDHGRGDRNDRDRGGRDRDDRPQPSPRLNAPADPRQMGPVARPSDWNEQPKANTPGRVRERGTRTGDRT